MSCTNPVLKHTIPLEMQNLRCEGLIREYRKQSCFLKWNSPSMPNLTLSPTILRSKPTLKVEDYG